MQKLERGVTFSRETTAKGENKVALKRTVKANEGSDIRYVIEATLDFKNVSREDLLKFAADSVWIILQRKWRVCYANEGQAAALKDATWCREFDVQSEIVEATRTRTAATPVAKARKALAEMSAEELEEFMKEIEAAKKVKKAA